MLIGKVSKLNAENNMLLQKLMIKKQNSLKTDKLLLITTPTLVNHTPWKSTVQLILIFQTIHTKYN
jgi:hypothetical protein